MTREGQERITLVVDSDMMEAIEAYEFTRGVTRSEAVRTLLLHGFKYEDRGFRTANNLKQTALTFGMLYIVFVIMVPIVPGLSPLTALDLITIGAAMLTVIMALWWLATYVESNTRSY